MTNAMSLCVCCVFRISVRNSRPTNQSINQAFIAGSMAHKNTQKTKKKGTHTHTHNYKLLTYTKKGN